MNHTVIKIATTLWLIGCADPATESATPAETAVTTESERTTTTSSKTTTFTEQTEGVELTAVDAIACDDPSKRETEGPFYTPDLGADWDNQLIGTRWPEAEKSTEFPGYGITIADLNGDGFEDIYLSNHGPNELFLGQADGTFVESSNSMISDTLAEQNSEGAVSADIDGDGDTDLIVFNRGGANTLFINDETGTLQLDVNGLKTPSRQSVGGALGDMDGDGDLDLVVSNHIAVEHVDGEVKEGGGDENELYQLDLSTMTYVDNSTAWDTELAHAYTFVTAWVDMNLDGLPDLYFANDYGAQATPNRLLKNIGGTFFRDVTSETDTNARIGAMGIAIGDTNGDLMPDLLISNWGEPVLLESIDGESWYRAEQARELAFYLPKKGPDDHAHYPLWGNALEDIDNDGDVDAILVGGQVFGPVTGNNPPEVPNALFLRDGDVFVERGVEWGFDDIANHRGMVITDLNNDGYLDILARDVNGPARAWYSNCGEDNWLKVKLVQPTPNRDAAGARVEVYAGDLSLVRWVVNGGTSFASSGPSTVHFGLAQEQSIDAVRIYWPDGLTSTFVDFVPNQTLTLTRTDLVESTPKTTSTTSSQP